MNLFRKIFSAKSKEGKKTPEKDQSDKYLPKKELPVDELFTVNFNQNGGKFLYSESLEEAQTAVAAAETVAVSTGYTLPKNITVIETVE